MMNEMHNTGYGVKQLIMINSGTVEYLRLNLNLPLHLNAENNIGKTSTVNTLQFLYIDTMDDMFLPSSNQHSANFYFRDEYSYLIFECVSKTGTYCVILNRPADSRRYYNRHVIPHAFDESIFIGENSSPREWSDVLEVLSDREVIPKTVANTEWWRVLSGLTEKNTKKQLPALFILPVKDLESYRRFKMIYKHLLSMSSIKLETFKDILLACAVASGEKRKIDFAEKEYQSRFTKCRDLQRQQEYYLKNEKEIENLQERDKELRLFQRRLPANFALLRYNYNNHSQKLAQEEQAGWIRLHDIEAENKRLIEGREKVSQRLGTLLKDLEIIQKQIMRFEELENNEELYLERQKRSLPELIEYKEKSVDSEFFLLTDKLKNLKNYSRQGLEERVKRIQNDIDKCRNLLENDDLFFSWLLNQGISEDELAKLAAIFQTELLTRKMADISVKDKEKLLTLAKAVAANIDNNLYEDSHIKIPVEPHEISELTDREKASRRVKELDLELKEAQEKLNLYLQEESNLEKLDRLGKEKVHLAEMVKLYEHYNELEVKLPQLKKDENKLIIEKDDLSEQKAKFEEQAEGLEEEVCELRDAVTEMESSLRMLKGDYSRLHDTINQHFPDIVTKEIKFKEEILSFEYVSEELPIFSRKVENITRDIQDMKMRKSQILDKVGLIYDQEKDWTFYIDANSNTSQAAERVDKEWRTFFGLAKHDFRSLVQCVDSIRNLLRSIDRTFSRKQISNLARIKVGIDPNDLYHEAREFTVDSDDLFADASKRRIYTGMFKRYFENKFSDLRAEDMFHIKIEIANPNNPAESKNITSFDNESEGTNYTIKALLLSQLLKEQFKFGLYQENIIFHYYLDEIGQLDEENLANIVTQNKEKNLIPITAAPRPVIDPLCHPECRVVTLKEHPDSKLTYVANESTFTAQVMDVSIDDSINEDELLDEIEVESESEG